MFLLTVTQNVFRYKYTSIVVSVVFTFEIHTLLIHRCWHARYFCETFIFTRFLNLKAVDFRPDLFTST